MKKLLLSLMALFAMQSAMIAQCTSRPVINSFSPNTGFIGSQVTIVGANFDATTITNNQVYFGSTQATVVSATFGTLVVTVPVGASTAPISVKNQCNLTAYSSTAFNGIFCPTPVTSSTYQNVAFDLTGVYGAYNMLSQDMDLDGKPEVISVGTGGITIARNNSVPGTLSFTAYNYVGGGQQGVAADMDGDGFKDMVCTYNVYRNTSSGPGTFGLAAGVSTNAVSNYQIAAGDFNNDGKIDVVGCNGTSIYVALNNSTGPGNISFAPRIYVNNVGASCTGIQVADVDGDGLTDILATQGGANRAVSLRNTTTQGSPSVTFESPEYWSSGGTYPYRCQIADFDKDGKIDLTTCNYSGSTNTAIFRNTSSVGDISFAPSLNLAAPTGNYRIGVGDVDGDGYPDIVTKSLAVNIFSVYPNTSSPGNLSFASRIDYSSSHQAEVSGIVIGDLDGDYVPDIATSGTSSGRIKFHRNTSSQSDVTPPTAACKNIILALSPSGNASITAASIDNGSSDACGIDNISISQSTFTCADIGTNNVTLLVTDNAGNKDSCTAIVTVAPAAIIVSGQTTVCDGQTVPLTANLGDSYQWKKDGVAISGATSQNYTATTSGNYTVEVTNAGGCSGESAPTAITVNSNPTVAVSPSPNAYLCPNNVTLTASTSAIYQWKKNGVDINGANVQTYNATSTGSYQVQVIDLFGCSALSDVVTVSNTVAEIAVAGNGNNITDGSTTASAANGSDYGTVYPSVNNDQSFTISNSGSGNMTVSGITVSGTDASLWSISGISFPTTIATGSSATFVASFNGPTIGSYSAVINIASDDCDETNFDFAVAAEITCVVPIYSTCPSTQTVSTSGSCGQVVSYLAEASGVPAVSISYSFSGATTGNGVGTGTGTNFNVGTTNVTLTATNSCGTSTCEFDIVVSDDTEPVVLTDDITVYLDVTGNATITAQDIDAGSYDNCGIDTMYLDHYTFDCGDVSSGGGGVSNFSFASFGFSGDVILTVVDVNGNLSAGVATVTVLDTVAPTVLTQGATVYLDSNGSGSITVNDINNGTNDSCGVDSLWLSQTSFDCSNLGSMLVTLSATDVNGNTSSAPATITVVDTLIPVVLCPSNIAVNTDSNICGSIVNFAAPVGFDNCSAVTTSLTDGLDPGSLFPVGTTTVTYTTGASGVLFYDEFDNNNNGWDLGPEWGIGATAANNCGNGCTGGSDPAFDHSSSSNNGVAGVNPGGCATTMVHGFYYLTSPIINTNVSGDIFFEYWRHLHSDYPPYAVNTVEVFNGTSWIVLWQMPPVSSYQCINDLDWTYQNFDVTAYKNAGFRVRFGFNITSSGVYTMPSWSVDDFKVYGTQTESSTCSFDVTVTDAEAPNVVTQAITVQLDSSGNASIETAQIDNGSNDACGIDTMYLSTYAFDCSNVGANTLTLTVTDINGNTSTENAIVTIEDNIAPVVTFTPADQSMNNLTGSCFQNTMFSIPTFTDACGVTSVVQTNDNGVFVYPIGGGNYVGSFPVGVTTVTYTATDASNNVTSTSFTVTVIDNEAPYLYGCPGQITVFNDAGSCGANVTWADPTPSDNCPNWMMTSTHNSGDYFPVGNTVVTYTLMDPAGNTVACSFLVTVADIEAPVAVCQNISTYLDASGNASITASQIENGSTDNCGIASLSLDNYSFTCANVGANTVTLTVTDVNGNNATCTSTVTVFDTITPAAIAQNVSVYLDATGNGSTTAALVDNGSNDACGIASLSLDNTSFTCANVGANSVTLTVSDNNGNVSSTQAIVTVIDTIAPSVATQSVVVYLDASGNGSITAQDVDNGSSDACGVASVSLDNSSFTCANVGTNSVTLTVTDINGNSASAPATVTVIDTVAPEVLTQAVFVALDSNGAASITASQVDNGSNDACGVASVSLDNMSFTCSDLGNNTVILTVTDVNGNSASNTAPVTVVDLIAPIAIAQNFTVQLDAAGNGSITAQDIDNGSTDNCSVSSISIDNSSFTCADVNQTNTVTLTVIDQSGNSSTATATVTVEDNVAPTAVAQNVTVHLDATGNASITAQDVDNGSNDACGVASISIDNNSFTCSDVNQANTVTLTVTDNNGNVSSTTATVTVEDNVGAVVVTQNASIVLDASGSGSITVNDVENGSTDACGIASISVDQSTFDCSNVGANTVTVTVTDVNGNVSMGTATVTVSEGKFVAISSQNNISEACASTAQGGTHVSWIEPTANSFTSCNEGCPTNTNINGFSFLGEYNGHRYYRSNWQTNWANANAAAQAAGGHLVSINSQGENDFVEDNSGSSYVWIGLTDANVEGTFEWTNGDAVGYTNWDNNEPNNNGGGYCGPSGADYVVMSCNDGDWKDRNGAANYHYILEIECSNPISIIQVSGGVNGSLFGAGVDTIVYQATDDVTGATTSMSFTVSIDACPEITYCSASGSNSNYEWIDRVRLTGNGGFNNQSGNDGGYGDYTNIVGEVEAGEDFDLKLYPGYSGSSYTEYWRVFIDWNDDGDFNDWGELVYQGHGCNMRTAEIDVPNNAQSGEVTMRVVMKWGGYPSSCGSFSYGEVEDYTLIVEGNNSNGGSNNGSGYCNNYSSDKTDGGSASEESISQATYELARLYPNPYANGADLKLEIRSLVTEQMELDVVNSMGQIVETLSIQAVEGINTINLDVKPLAAGVYFVRSSSMEGRGIEFIVQ